MSLVPSYIFCTDGKTYRNLVYWAEDKSWFVCFDDDDPVELVARIDAHIDPNKVLTELGIPYERLTKRYTCGRMFGKKFYQAESWFMDVRYEPFPTPRPHDEHEGILKVRNEGVYFGLQSVQKAFRVD